MTFFCVQIGSCIPWVCLLLLGGGVYRIILQLLCNYEQIMIILFAYYSHYPYCGISIGLCGKNFQVLSGNIFKKETFFFIEDDLFLTPHLSNFLFSLVTKVIFFPLKCFSIFLLHSDVHCSPSVTLSHSDPLLFPPNTLETSISLFPPLNQSLS